MMLWIFFAVAFVAFLGALGLVFHSNPMVAGLCMAVAMVAQGCLYMLLHVPFLGFFQIIIYAGAVMVMAVFIIMAHGMAEQGQEVSLTQTVATYVAAVLFLVQALRAVWNAAPPAFTEVDRAFGSLQQFGNLLVEHYAVPFELASLVLLTAMVGAVVMARRIWE
ncbi:MAG: NADH-quinone oxidoreductase subunit J [Acidobacteria bacterium]|jgi:NADH-quinone oxidoreductase subunit J|nr:NADH-quinone oxidoreductase subunit J [Acidobacteriota bacterium]